MTEVVISDIMKVGCDNVLLEYQRYGRNKTTLVNKAYIDSGEYRKKFDKLTDNTAVNKSLYECAKKALKHRNGTMIEDMYWIDSDTGAIVASVTEQTEKTLERVEYSQNVKNIIKNKKNLIAIHTHPNSMSPSAADFNSCLKNGYKAGIIACHDGKLFKYLSNQEISETLYILYIEEFIDSGKDEYEAQLSALLKIKENHKIDFWEVTANA